VLLIILVFCVVCFVFVCGGSGGWVSVLSNTEPPQTNKIHTTQKTKMTRNTGWGLCCLSF
jgi:hypothetical protein